MKSSASNNCLTLLTNLNIEATSVDTEQTAAISLIGVLGLCHRLFLNSSAGGFSCDWCFQIFFEIDLLEDSHCPRNSLKRKNMLNSPYSKLSRPSCVFGAKLFT